MGKQIARTTTPLGFRGPLDDLFLMGYHSYFVRVWKDTILKLFYYFSFLRLYPRLSFPATLSSTVSKNIIRKRMKFYSERIESEISFSCVEYNFIQK